MQNYLTSNYMNSGRRNNQEKIERQELLVISYIVDTLVSDEADT